MPWFPKQRVLVPVDFSDLSFAAVDVACELVSQPSDVVAVHVLLHLSPVEPGEIWRTVDDASRVRHAAGALRERLPESKYPGMKIDVRVGDPGHEIADCAEREKAELIVIPSHGRTGLPRLLIGSVAERVIRLSHCPVLVLRR